MDFNGILTKFKQLISPPPSDVPTISVNEKMGNGMSPAMQAKLDANNKAFLADWNSKPMAQAQAPEPSFHSILGAQTAQAQPPADDLWGKFSDVTRKQATARGYDADTVIRQKALESGFGKSNFARERNNFGGIGAYDRDPNQAFKFDDIESYLDYYFNLVEKRYPEAYTNRKNPQKFVEGLKKGGYASDPEYVWKVMNTPLKPR